MIYYPNRIGGEPAADSKKNRISTKGRNALIIAPYSIRVTIENNQESPNAGILTLASGGESSSFSAPAGEQRGALAVATVANIHDWSAVANLRAIVGEGDKATLSVSVKVNTQAEKQETSRVSMTVKWRGETQSTPDFWLNSLENKPFFLGDIVFDRTTLSLDIDTSKVVSYKQGDVIEDDSGGGGGGDDDDPKDFEIQAPYYWCVGGFTESEQPTTEDYVWPRSSLTGIRAEGESIESAKERLSLGRIVTVTSRRYLIPDGYSDERIAGKKFWRDEEKDVISGSREVRVIRATIAGRSNEYGDFVWIECAYGESTELNGKRVFSDASPSADIDDSEKADYTTDKLEIGVTDWQDPHPDHFPWCLHGACDEDGNSLIPYANYSYMAPTGNSTTLTLPDNYYWFDFGFADDFDGKFYEYKTFDGKFTAWCTKFYNQSSGLVAAFPSKPYFGKDEEDFWSILPRVVASNGSHLRSLSSYYPPVTAVNGVFYDITDGTPTAGYVWDAQTYYAWTLSPCVREGAEVVTVYSDPAVPPEDITTPEAGDNGVTLFLPSTETENGEEITVWNECGHDSAAGSGIYSITSSRGATYHNSDGGDAAETAECADCAVTI